MKTNKNTLSKSERLTSRITISEIYAKGKHLNEFPIKIVYLIEDNSTKTGINVVFSVPKRKFKQAVDRNLIKRFLREAYRTNKHACVEEVTKNKINVSMFLVYIGTEIPQYKLIESKIKQSLDRLLIEIQPNT